MLQLLAGLLIGLGVGYSLQRAKMRALEAQAKAMKLELDASAALLEASAQNLLAGAEALAKTQELIDMTKKYNYVFCSVHKRQG